MREPGGPWWHRNSTSTRLNRPGPASSLTSVEVADRERQDAVLGVGLALASVEHLGPALPPPNLRKHPARWEAQLGATPEAYLGRNQNISFATS